MIVPFGTHYAPGRTLCRRCRHRYTTLDTCPDCVRRAYLVHSIQIREVSK